MAKFSSFNYAENRLGFGTPGFISPNQGSGARFGRVIPPRSRLVRFRGLGDSQVFDDGSMVDYGSGGDVTGYTDTSGNYTTVGSTVGTQTIVPSSTGGTTSIQTSILSDIGNLLRLGQQAVAQQRILDLNIARARQGLPMVDPRYFSPSAAVNFGLTPQAGQMLLIGGGALLLVMFLSRRKK